MFSRPMTKYMMLASTLLLLLLSSTLVSGQIQQRRPQKVEPIEGSKDITGNRDRQQRSISGQGNPECLEGNPLGANYSGNVNVTTSG